MKDIYRKYNDKGLEIVSISIDNDVNQWINVLEEENLSWLNLIDKNDIADLYGVKAVPSVFIIERKNGKIHGCRLFGESVTEKLIEIFGF